MDLTQFMHGGPAEIVACVVCGTARRNEQQAAQYESDRYDSALMRHLYPRYRDSFARKRDRFQTLLQSGAEVPEVGSHLGAFLEAFARRQGGSVKQVSLGDYSPAGRLDAIFIWNALNN
jgi:hypothetical protein